MRGRMQTETIRPGLVRDAILAHFKNHKEATVAELRDAAATALRRPVPASSVRSYLNLNVGSVFERVGRGRYRLKARP